MRDSLREKTLFNKSASSGFTLVEMVMVAAIICIVFIMLMPPVLENMQKRKQEELRITQENIDRAVRQCYALEGVYPQSLEYLRVNYGIEIRENKYIYKYSVFSAGMEYSLEILLKDGNDEVKIE